ncbi:hypothetical protein BC828DRAFT_378577 [Blastocladiella britannica]|nr:hypothetical protein BC828DRAFT_378577 [Blastocladiella britannica]
MISHFLVAAFLAVLTVLAALAVDTTATTASLSLVFVNSIDDLVTGVTVGTTTYGGYARMKTGMDTLEAAAPTGSTTLRVVGGNILGTTLFTQTFRGTAEQQLLGQLGISVVGMSTHDMFTTLDLLGSNFFAGAPFQLACSDCVVPYGHPLAPAINPYVIRVINGVRVAFVSFHPAEQCAKVNTCTANGKTVFQIIPNWIQYTVNMARVAGGADFVIALGAANNDAIAIDVANAALYTGLDLIFSYDTVATIATPITVGNTTVWNVWSQAGAEIARLDLQLTPGIPMVVAGSAKLRTVACANDASPTAGCTVSDPAVVATIAGYNTQMSAFTSTVIGTNPTLLNRTDCLNAECSLGNFATSALMWAAGQRCDYALVNQGMAPTNLPAGPSTVGQVRAVAPFGNSLAAADVYGRDLVDALNNGLSRAGLSSGRFPQISNMRIKYNPTRSWFKVDATGYGMRLESLLMWNKTTQIFEDVVMDRVYRMCINDYMLGGGDGYVQFKKAIQSEVLGQQIVDALLSYIPSLPGATITAVVDGRITPDTTSEGTLVGACTYPTLVRAAATGTLVDLCGNGRRATSNVTFLITPSMSSTVMSVDLTLSGLPALAADGSDYLVIFTGSQVSGTPYSMVVNGTQRLANFTGINGGYPATMSVTGSTVLVQYVSSSERFGQGLSVAYTAQPTCPLGYASSGSTCSPCAAGTFRDASATECTACAAGSYAPYAASPSCKTCAKPHYCPVAGLAATAECDATQGFVWTSPSTCVCPTGTVRTAAGCVVGSDSGATVTWSTVASGGFIALMLVFGAVWYRRRVRVLRDQAMGRRRLRKIRVNSRKRQIYADLGQCAFFVLLDCAEIILDWYTFASFDSADGDTFKLVYAGIAILGTTIVIISIIMRIQFAHRLYEIATEGIEVLQNAKKRGIRNLFRGGDKATRTGPGVEAGTPLGVRPPATPTSPTPLLGHQAAGDTPNSPDSPAHAVQPLMSQGATAVATVGAASPPPPHEESNLVGLKHSLFTKSASIHLNMNSLSSDPEFVEMVRKMHVLRQELQHARYVALPGIIKSLPMVVADAYKSLSHATSPTKSVLILGAFGSAVMALTFNLHVVFEWPGHLNEYLKLKVLVDKKLKEEGVARVSKGSEGVTSRQFGTLGGVPVGPPPVQPAHIPGLPDEPHRTPGGEASGAENSHHIEQDPAGGVGNPQPMSPLVSDGQGPVTTATTATPAAPVENPTRRARLKFTEPANLHEDSQE